MLLPRGGRRKGIREDAKEHASHLAEEAHHPVADLGHLGVLRVGWVNRHVRDLIRGTRQKKREAHRCMGEIEHRTKREHRASLFFLASLVASL
jgi:hypothetical protein